MDAAAEFAAEADLARVEAALVPALIEARIGQWRAIVAGRALAPPAPAECSAGVERWLAARRRHRRAELLWRLVCALRVEAEPPVAAAVVAGDAARARAARDRAARRRGWPSFAALARELAGAAEVDAALQAAGGGARVADDGASAWDGAAGTLAGRSPAAAVDAIAEAVEALGLSLGGVHIDASLVGTAGPVRAWTVPVDPPRDVRVWVRAPHAPAGWRALAHELGHAAFARAHDPALPWGLRGGTPRAVHEAVALVVERVAGARRPAGSVRSPARVADPLGAPAYAAGARLGAVVAARLAGQPPAAVGRALAPALAAGGAVAAGEWLARCGAPGARVSRAPAGRARRTPER